VCGIVKQNTRVMPAHACSLFVPLLLMSSDNANEALKRLIGARIRALRLAKGWTQEELGGRAEVDFRTVGGSERGERALSLASLHRIAVALDVDMAYLVRQETTESGAEGEALVEELLTTVRDLPLTELRHVVTLAQVHKDHLTKPKGSH
jgi:transcriptional regulator with XRE-family HTH domain